MVEPRAHEPAAPEQTGPAPPVWLVVAGGVATTGFAVTLLRTRRSHA